MDQPIRRCRDLDERLTPYVDDEATPHERREVEAHLSECPPCRDQATAERTAREVIHEHRNELRCCAPDGLRERCAHQTSAFVLRAPADKSAFAPQASADRSALTPHASTDKSARQPGVRSGFPRWLPLSLAATLVLAVTGVFLSGINSGVQALATGLALDHAKCFQFKGDTTKTVDAEVLDSKWEREQGWPIVLPPSEGDEQLRLLTVRRCLSTDGRVAHAMYLWRGEPLSVFVLPHATGRERVLEAMGRETAIWSANGRTYAVLADGHPANFSHIVNYVKTHAR
jgi:anti-sigma factor RsiW